MIWARVLPSLSFTVPSVPHPVGLQMHTVNYNCSWAEGLVRACGLCVWPHSCCMSLSWRRNVFLAGHPCCMCALHVSLVCTRESVCTGRPQLCTPEPLPHCCGGWRSVSGAPQRGGGCVCECKGARTSQVLEDLGLTLARCCPCGLTRTSLQPCAAPSGGCPTAPIHSHPQQPHRDPHSPQP